MEKSKLKNDMLRTRRLPFIALWAGTYAVVWALYGFWYRLVSAVVGHQQYSFPLTTGAIPLVAAMIQASLVAGLLKRSMSGWMLYTLIGCVITFYLYPPVPVTSISIGLLILPSALLQTIWLRKRVRSAWLWPVASLIAGLGFDQVGYILARFRQPSGFWAALLYGLIQGCVMLYLWTQAKDSQKAKADFVSDEDKEQHQRLQENEAAVMASISDEKGAQQRNTWRF